MNLRISQSETEGISVLELRGRLVFGESEASLRDCIAGLREAKAFKILLNIKEIEDVDADGLGALVLCAANLRNAGGAMKLLNANINRLDSNILLKLETDFEVFTDLQLAINSFFPDRATQQFDILEFVNGLKKYPSPGAS